MGLDEETAREEIKYALKRLRKNGRYRIKLSRLPVGLPAELSARIQNSAITYLLAGRADQQMPTLLYYQQLSPTTLRNAYSEAIRHMFPHA